MRSSYMPLGVISTADLMKKGLRRHTACHLLLHLDFNRRPDEEGIKTGSGRCGGQRGHFNRRPDEEGIKTATAGSESALRLNFNRRPDEEGIKTAAVRECPSRMHFNRRPDEEGIKTNAAKRSRQVMPISTADLMKKGLRLEANSTVLSGPTISTADLMKKGLRPVARSGSARRCISTADLMKKGLTHLYHPITQYRVTSDSYDVPKSRVALHLNANWVFRERMAVS